MQARPHQPCDIVRRKPEKVKVFLYQGHTVVTEHLRYLTGPLGKRMRPKVIELQQVTLMHEWRFILRDVTLDIFEGESIALLGGPGSGKSALLACVQGQIQPVKGRVRVLGAELPPLPPKLRRQIGVLPQQLEERDQEKTVKDYLQRFASYHAIQLNNEQIMTYCASYELAPTRPVTELSSLQRRTLALALALVHDPRLVLLDDPLAGLSAQDQEIFWTYLQRTRHEGRTLLCAFTPPLAQKELSGYDLIVTLEQGYLSRQEG